MNSAKVIGTVVATRKDERLNGVRLMVIQPIDSAGNAKGSPIVAGDLPNPEACCDAGITAIIDSMYTGY